ncbi:MAG: hypothetical protein MJA32_09140, partial [Proteobacteria bacterium]|nr:hypothetical protein [Pseudomonadota bacterium]
GQLVSSVLVLALGGGIFWLALAYSAWFLVQVVFSAAAARAAFGELVGSEDGGSFDADVFAVIWQKTWRSALGILMGFGVLQFSGIGYAQIASAGESASYLLALRVLGSMVQFAQAPFYSRIPEMAALRAADRTVENIRLAQRSMWATYWLLVIGFIAVSVLAGPFLAYFEADVEFVATDFWLLLAFGGLVERYGAMHLQFYSTTNHILWHWANGIAGILYILVVLTSFPVFGHYAFPIAYCCGNLGFYSWFSARLSYRSVGISMRDFERSAVALPGLFFVIVAGVVLIADP